MAQRQHLLLTTATIPELATLSIQPSKDDSLMLPQMEIPSVITPLTHLLPAQFAFVIPHGVLSQEDIDALQQGKKFIHFQGYIKYRDVFDRYRETRFCYSWRKTIGDWAQSGVLANWET